MMDQQDIDYLLMREAQERECATSSQDQSVRSVHFELAERYADAAWAAEELLGSPVRPSGLWPQHDILPMQVDMPIPQ